MNGLTATELSWLRKLQKVMKQCPSRRIGFFSIGDADVTLYDKTYDSEIMHEQGKGKDFCAACYDVGANLDAHIRFPSLVHSTSG